MGEDGGDGDGSLDGEGEADRGDEGGEEGAGELGCVEEGAEDCHVWKRGLMAEGRGSCGRGGLSRRKVLGGKLYE